MKSTKRTIAIVLTAIMLLSCLFCIDVGAANKKSFWDYEYGGYNISAYINGTYALPDRPNNIRYTYTGSAITPPVVVKWKGSKTLKEGTDYILKYELNVNPGLAGIIIKGKGNYSGSEDCFFSITPKHPVVISYSVSNTSISVKCKNSKGGKGAYGAVYDTNNNRVSKAQITKTGSSEYTLKVSNLKNNKKYTLKLKSLYMSLPGEKIAPDAQSIVFYT